MTKQTTFEDDFSKEVWETTYKDHNDNNVDDTFRRVAKAVASVEKNSQLREEWEEKFYDMLSEFKITTGGRIYSNAGTEFTGTTLANCFVGTKPKQDQDSLDGILEVLRAQAKTLKSEGGWGMNFSFIRPRGAFIHGIGVETPGAVKYMELFDKSSDIITAGSGSKSKNKKAKGKIRKGAMMGVLSVWHPDIVEFIEAKLTDGRLTKFNISVNCTNDFMDKVIQAKKLKIESEENPEKVKEFEESNIWELIFPETTHEKYKKEWDGNIATWKNKGYPVNVYRTIGVLELWDKIIKSTYTRNDPGVLFCDIGNKTHCWNYGKNSDIQATNPCFHGDTMVAVADGRNAVTIKQLAEEGKDVPVYTINPITGIVEIKMGINPRITGFEQELLEVKFSDGNAIKVTPNHKFLLMDGQTKNTADLICGDTIPSITNNINETNTKKLQTILKSFYVDRILMVEKTCEYTNTKFTVPWEMREICYNPFLDPTELYALKAERNKKTENTFSENVRSSLSITEVNKIEGLHTVYNITTEDNHTIGIINNTEPNNYKGIFTLQCGEQLLPFGGICNLASVNLTQFLNKDRTDFDHKKLQKYLPILTRFSDNVNDYSNAPLDEYIDSMRNRRRIGLGVSGWGSALYLLKTRFASEEAETIKARMMKTFTHTVVKASIELAKEKGMFKECDPAKHASSNFWKQINLPQDLIDDIEKYGIRNSALFSIQPTGNTSILANIISGGLEPLFLSEYIRTVIVPSCPEDFKEFVPKYWEGEFKENEYFKLHKEGNDDILKYKHTDGILYKIDKNRGLTKEVLCEDYAVRHLKKTNEWNPDADWAVTTMSLSVDEHVADMSGWGKWIDSSMSKTVNVPNDYPFDKFENLYLDTYKTGYLKGITTYRAGTMTNVLAAKTIESSETGCKVCKREKDLIGDIYHTNAKGVSYFVIVGLDKNGLPYEIFAGKNGFFPKSIETGTIHKVKRGLYQLIGENDNVVIESITEHLEEEEEALTRMISMSLRHGVDINYVVHQLEKVKGALNSLSKCMSRCLKKYIKNGTAVSGEECPACGKETLIRAEGCKKCMNCSNSICG